MQMCGCVALTHILYGIVSLLFEFCMLYTLTRWLQSQFLVNGPHIQNTIANVWCCYSVKGWIKYYPLLLCFSIRFHKMRLSKKKKMQNKLYTNQDQFDNNFHK